MTNLGNIRFPYSFEHKQGSLGSIMVQGSMAFNLLIEVLDTNILCVNLDCGLKTPKFGEVKPALRHMIYAPKQIHKKLGSASEQAESIKNFSCCITNESDGWCEVGWG
ncbi:hypothetical protein LIER_43332 [Lithospermum erythrorhizon]|uniref:Uncharacterized protein n=1 Tax=Lithospermum erythrorhizon TaxID=34254 RepID=A0AAV3PXP9_LITER